MLADYFGVRAGADLLAHFFSGITQGGRMGCDVGALAAPVLADVLFDACGLIWRESGLGFLHQRQDDPHEVWRLAHLAKRPDWPRDILPVAEVAGGGAVGDASAGDS